MKCDDATLLLSARTDGEPVNDASLDRHLEHCQKCQAFVRTTMQIRRSVRLTQVDGTVDVTETVLTRLQDQQLKGSRPKARLLVAAAVLLAAVATAGFALGRSSTNTSIDAAAAPPPSLAAPTSNANNAEASTLSNLPDGEGELVAIWNQDALHPAIEPFVEANTAASTTVRRNTVALAGSASANGELADVLEEGWTIPLDAIAVDTDTYAAVTGVTDFPAMNTGEAVLSETSAELRRLDVGASLDMAGTTLTVISIVPDEVVGAAELAVNYESGEAIGITTDRYILARTTLAPEEYGALLPEGLELAVRIRDRTSTQWLRNSDAVLPQLIVKKMFGEFATRPAGEGFDVDPVWAESNLETVDLPGVGVVTCHRLVMPIVQRAIETAATNSTETDGCWNPRNVRSTGDLSRHTWGIAIDLTIDNPDIVALLESEGLMSGADWLAPDPEHYEYTSLEAPSSTD